MARRETPNTLPVCHSHILCICLHIIVCEPNLHKRQGGQIEGCLWKAGSGAHDLTAGAAVNCAHQPQLTRHSQPCPILETILPSTSTLADFTLCITARIAFTRSGPLPLLPRPAAVVQQECLVCSWGCEEGAEFFRRGIVRGMGCAVCALPPFAPRDVPLPINPEPSSPEQEHHFLNIKAHLYLSIHSYLSVAAHLLGAVGDLDLISQRTVHGSERLTGLQQLPAAPEVLWSQFQGVCRCHGSTSSNKHRRGTGRLVCAAGRLSQG